MGSTSGIDIRHLGHQSYRISYITAYHTYAPLAAARGAIALSRCAIGTKCSALFFVNLILLLNQAIMENAVPPSLSTTPRRSSRSPRKKQLKQPTQWSVVLCYLFMIHRVLTMTYQAPNPCKRNPPYASTRQYNTAPRMGATVSRQHNTEGTQNMEATETSPNVTTEQGE